MEIVLFFATVLNLISVYLNIYSYKRYIKLTDHIAYPEYYKDVWIYYHPPEEITDQVEKAWLAVNDDGEYIWTRCDNDQIIPDEWVTHWEYIK